MIFIRVKIGSGNHSLPDGNEPLPETILTHYQRNRVIFIWGNFKMPRLSVTKITLPITHNTISCTSQGQWVRTTSRSNSSNFVMVVMQDSRFKHRLFHKYTNIHICIVMMNACQKMFQNGNIHNLETNHQGPKAAAMIATNHKMVHGALRTVIHKRILKQIGAL